MSSEIPNLNLKPMTAVEPRRQKCETFAVAEPTHKQPKSARGPRNYLRSNSPPRFNEAEIREATRRGFEKTHDDYSRRQNYLLKKDFYEEDRLREFNFKRELAKHRKAPPRRIVDHHTLEKVVSRRRMQLQESQTEAKDGLPVLNPPFSPRIPLPKEKPQWYPTKLHVFYWA